MPPDIPARLDPKSLEAARYREWLDGGYFRADPRRVLEEGADPYVIVIPPPNVTAVLHMGHGLNASVQDVLVRWMRMSGCAALWVPGTDHAGIATQNVVERRLARRGIDRHRLGRERFVEEVWDFVRETGPRILDQLRAIGASCDWDRTCFTLDDGLSRAVRTVFAHLHSKGLVYRGEYLINWCSRCRTALSNEEAESREVTGMLWNLRYPLDLRVSERASAAHADGADSLGRLPDGRWYLTVSTTRPETMLGDTGVAVHPEDERYSALVGTEVELPLTGRSIPLVADEHVNPDFGSGMVKVTPAHDPNDFEIARRIGLESLSVLDEDGRVSGAAPSRFHALASGEARKAVLDELDALGLVGGREEIVHGVPHCYRCDTVVEPRLSKQWFVRMKPLAEPALRAWRDGEVTFTPKRWGKVYEHWMENIRDWCISRQLWWGHRIPVWYCGCGEEIVALEDPSCCPACGSSDIEQDPDVLDTWFSSQLWPFSVFGWPERNPDLEAFYPGHTMVTAPEILFFWVARMIMMGIEFEGEAPFSQVYLHGTVRDALGRKMSKSLGNGIDPLEVVESHGADAMRYTLISQCAVGTDINLDHTNVESAFASGRNFANKIWNAGRFAIGALGDDPILGRGRVETHLRDEDRWILSRTGAATRSVTRSLERFRLHEVAETLYRFFWGELCDWYLELVKERLKGEAGADREAARTTLTTVLDLGLRLLHPLMPFVTSEVWSRLPTREGDERAPDLMVAAWPGVEDLRENLEAETRVGTLVEVISFVRRMRREYGAPAHSPVEIHVGGAPAWLGEMLGRDRRRLWRLARIEKVAFSEKAVSSVTGQGAGQGAGDVRGSTDERPNAQGARAAGAHAVVGGLDLFIPLSGLIDIESEIARLTRMIGDVEGRLAGSGRRLANPGFVSKAPAAVVDKERRRFEELGKEIAGLREKLERLGGAE